MENLTATHASIAVIIPSYNQALYVREAVESVFKQSLQPQQVIVVDDGSTDDSGTVLSQLQQEFPSLIVIRQENAGVCAASHAGLAQVASDYVLRLDADDWIPENYLAELHDSLMTDPGAAFAFCDAQLFGAKQGWIRAGRWSLRRIIPENRIHVSSLVRTEAARKVGYFNPVMRGGYEDWDFYLSLGEAGYRGAYCKTTFLWYRQKDDGGRNTMDREKDRGLRAQIMTNHPALYKNPINKLAIFWWRVQRRVKHWFGKA